MPKRMVIVCPPAADVALGIAQAREVPYAEYMRPFRQRVREAQKAHDAALRAFDFAAHARCKVELQRAKMALAEATPQ